MSVSAVRNLNDYALLTDIVSESDIKKLRNDRREMHETLSFSFAEAAYALAHDTLVYTSERDRKKYAVFFVQWRRRSQPEVELATRMLLPTEVENPLNVLSIQQSFLEVLVIDDSERESPKRPCVLAFPLGMFNMKECYPFFKHRLKDICSTNQTKFEKKKAQILRAVLLQPLSKNEALVWLKILRECGGKRY